MTNVYYVLNLAAQAGLLFLLYGLLQEARQVRCVLNDRLRQSSGVAANRHTVVTGSFRAPFCPPVYAIWLWRDTCWELELATVPLGHEPEGPPPFNGSYPGQRVKTECVRL